MNQQRFTYVIVGAGLSAASSVRGIREIDRMGTICILGSESYRPYNRPPLSKGLWTGKKQVEEIFVDDEGFYRENNCVLKTGCRVVYIDTIRKKVELVNDETIGFERLLLATGGTPRRLTIPGGDLECVCYYRTLDDYLRIRSESGEGRSILIIGGGFIGSELAASMSVAGFSVTLLFPDKYICSRVFPSYLGTAMQQMFRNRGIEIIAEDRPAVINKKNGTCLTMTTRGVEIESDLIIAGIGIEPESSLAEKAGLYTARGVVVNDYLESSVPGIYAAGDVAVFPYQALHRQMRVEHWDNALHQGVCAGRNMAGAGETYTYIPYFFSDLFEFGYEAVGEVNSELHTVADWQKVNEKGVIYYHDEHKVLGVMLFNALGKLDEARELLSGNREIAPDHLRGSISVT